MSASLEPQAESADEALRTLEHALTGASTQWNDMSRRTFDQSHSELIVASGRRAASDLAALAKELRSALTELDDALGAR